MEEDRLFRNKIKGELHEIAKQEVSYRKIQIRMVET